MGYASHLPSDETKVACHKAHGLIAEYPFAASVSEIIPDSPWCRMRRVYRDQEHILSINLDEYKEYERFRVHHREKDFDGREGKKIDRSYRTLEDAVADFMDDFKDGIA